MKLFYTKSAEHLAKKINIPKGKFTSEKFSDSEIHIKIKEKIKNQTAWVLASTNQPAENLIELFLLLDALQRNQAKINLIITYFGYARQDRIVETGESLALEVICKILNTFKIKKIITLHIHSPQTSKYIKHTNIIPIELYLPIIKKMDSIVAPDIGALPLAKKINSLTNLPIIQIEKTRPSKEKLLIKKITGNVKNKKVILIDDMIASGGTILKSAQKLKRKGAKEINVIATHGIFSQNAIKNIEKSPIKTIYTTNSIKQETKSKKIKTIDLSKYIEKIIKQK